MSKATNKATTGKSKGNGKKVSHAKLSVNVARWHEAETHEASALAQYVAIGRDVAEDDTRGLATQLAEATGESTGRISKMKKVWLAHEHSEAEVDDEFSWEDYATLDKAYTAACAYIGKRETSRPKAQPKTSGKVTADALIKSLGKAEAKRLALAILASV